MQGFTMMICPRPVSGYRSGICVAESNMPMCPSLATDATDWEAFRKADETRKSWMYNLLSYTFVFDT